MSERAMKVIVLSGMLCAANLLAGRAAFAQAATPLAPPEHFASKCLMWFPAMGNPLLVNIWNNCRYCVVAVTHWVFVDGRTQDTNLSVRPDAQITISLGGTIQVHQVAERVC